MEQIKNRLRKAMEIRGMRQQDIIEKTGLSSSTISQYLSGRNEPKQKNIYIMARALSVSPEWLMGFDADMEWKENVRITNREKELLYACRGLNDEGQQALLAYVKYLASREEYTKKGSEAVG